jgi:hypothetical protein
MRSRLGLEERMGRGASLDGLLANPQGARVKIKRPRAEVARGLDESSFSDFISSCVPRRPATEPPRDALC